jgi:hypothetical protein
LTFAAPEKERHSPDKINLNKNFSNLKKVKGVCVGLPDLTNTCGVCHTHPPAHLFTLPAAITTLFSCKYLIFINYDGVAKSPPYSVTAFFQDLDILDICLRP